MCMYLHADGAAISVAQAFEQFAKCERAVVLEGLAMDGQVHVGLGEAENSGVEFRRRRRRQTERIDARMRWPRTR